MRFLYLDAVGGAAGDMLIAAFLDGFVPFDYFQEEIKKLGLPDYHLVLEETRRHHIGAKKFTVETGDSSARHFSQIKELILKSTLKPTVKERAVEVFQQLGEIEANVHQMPLEKVHFHEVGAVDSIIDITGFFICLDYIHADAVFCSPLPYSRGVIRAAHGTLPVPAPATLNILKGYPLIKKPVEGELVTPTGAALFKYISEGTLPDGVPFSIDRVGYGAGTKDFKEIPNLVRIWTGQTGAAVLQETVLQIETNIDDMNPEVYPYLQDKLFQAGAMDVTFYQGIMKKGRPGILITILAARSVLPDIRRILYEETSTIGFRYHELHREKLHRKIREIDSPWGRIKVKEVIWNDKVKLLPEYEECRRIATEKKLPLLDFYKSLQTYLEEQRGQNKSD